MRSCGQVLDPHPRRTAHERDVHETPSHSSGLYDFMVLPQDEESVADSFELFDHAFHPHHFPSERITSFEEFDV